MIPTDHEESLKQKEKSFNRKLYLNNNMISLKAVSKVQGMHTLVHELIRGHMSVRRLDGQQISRQICLKFLNRIFLFTIN